MPSKRTGRPTKLLNFISERRWSLALYLLVLSMLSYSWMFSSITVPNERSRVYLSVAMVDNGTIAIDDPVKRFGRPIDIAKHDGHYYTDKAPGSSFLGATVYGLARTFTEPDDWTIVELVNLVRTWVMLPIGLLGFLLIRKTMFQLSVSNAITDVVSLGWILGTAAFHYSTAFFGHQIVAVSFIAAVFLIESATSTNQDGAKDWLKFLGAGVALGIAGITEYQSAVPCVLVGIYCLVRGFPKPSRLVAFTLGASAFVAVLLSYNSAAFGGFFELSYHHLSDSWMQAKHSDGIAGVTYPSAQAVFGSTLSLHRGLIATSPFLIFFPVGLLLMWRQKKRGLCLLMSATVLYYLSFVFSAEIWYGGWGFGPRLLVPGMGFMAVAVAIAGDAICKNAILSGLLRGLVIYAVVVNQLVQMTFAELPETAKNPIIDAVIPAIKNGLLSPNLASKLTGAPGLWTIVPIGILTMTALSLVLFRGLKLGGSIKKKISYSAALSVALISMFAITLATGPTWSQHKSKRHVENIKRYTISELD